MSERSRLLHDWLTSVLKTSNYELKSASEDASFRCYYRVITEDGTRIVMDAPPQHEDCRQFMKITRHLLQSGVNVPIIYEKNIEQGFLLLTDFGDELYLHNLNQYTVDTLYEKAIDTLIKMQMIGGIAELDIYDENLLRNEITLFQDWLLTNYLNIELSCTIKKALNDLADILIANALEQPRVFVHRDYHSRNLMLPDEPVPGVIDYQDAVQGPLTYDLVSLLKDCYIKWPIDRVRKWMNYYLVQLREVKKEVKMSRDQFQRWFDLMGVQRHLKASGIFARLSKRDNKHGFLNDIPRTLSYISDLKQDYPELNLLSDLVEENILPCLEKMP